jgi:hypothetical protein
VYSVHSAYAATHGMLEVKGYEKSHSGAQWSIVDSISSRKVKLGMSTGLTIKNGKEKTKLAKMERWQKKSDYLGMIKMKRPEWNG